MPGTLPFAGAPLGRDDALRADPARLAALAAATGALLLELDGLAPVTGEGGGLRWTPAAALPEGPEAVFLGLIEGRPAFALVPAAGDAGPAYAHRPSWEAINRLPADDLAIYGTARSVIDWHARHRFCACCGAPTRLAKAGWQRDCSAGRCGAAHFPRVDPVAIMLVEHEGALLLGRQSRFPPRSFSALAGFVEPGESIEEAVAREVFEEAGVTVGAVRYIASQPWPFPSQLMIGCHALATSRALTIDPAEIEEARWFTREDVAEALERGAQSTSFVPPPARAIAFHMLQWWLERQR